MSLIVPARREYRVVTETDVPMQTRDGVTLYADIVRPDAPGRFPVLLSRTPYGKGGSTDPNGPNTFFARYGYVSVTQDCRGRWSSEGEYDTIFQEAADGYDAVEWAARLPWSNGRVGTTGQSYLGLTQYLIACTDPMPPSLQVMAPVSASSDYHQSWIYHTGGASLWGWLVPYAIFKGRNTLRRAGRDDLVERVASYIDGEHTMMRKTPFGLNFTTPLTEDWFRHLPIADWGELLAETAPYFAEHVAHADDGPYWYRANVNRHAASVTVPMLHVTSWYDIFAEGGPNAYRSVKDHSRFPAARNGQRLIIGPWGHLLPYSVPSTRGAGDIDFGPEAMIDLNQTLLRWFDHWLYDAANGIMDEPPVTVFTLGENRWQHLDDWPPPNMRAVRWYLHSAGDANSLGGGGTLSMVPPGADEPDDSFDYDPADPVPTLGGNNLIIDMGVQDQRPVEERRDVLVFTSEPLPRPLEITGPIRVELWATSSAVDTDFTAKLVDVRPDGYAMNLQDGMIRARYRDSASEPVAMEPGRPYRFEIDLWNTSNVFLPGHRIRVEISSSNFPRFDRNLNTGEAFGEGSTGVVAHQTVFHRADRPSCVVLPVIPR
ncbi:MAG: CocE/NonD family hydrolase [Acidimicrobiia bacterium]|nr:CocE/NonD family hydrolase [Acidimicrobiia bacterium]MDH5278658.1 CocE/NonD family hydrolase [Actinomycetota bacterium]